VPSTDAPSLARAAARARPRVELETPSASVAIVTLVGEHDVATSEKVAQGLKLAATRRRHVLVDLSPCTFVDSTVIGLLLGSHDEVTSDDGSFVLILPGDSGTHTARVLELMQLGDALVMHDSLDAALASLEHTVRVRDLRARFGEPDRFRAECSCGWTGQEQTGVLAMRHARADGTGHTESRPARARSGTQR
jgi:anti-sigma B factor antagonist